MRDAIRDVVRAIRDEPFDYLACVLVVVGIFALAWFR